MLVCAGLHNYARESDDLRLRSSRLAEGVEHPESRPASSLCLSLNSNNSAPETCRLELSLHVVAAVGVETNATRINRVSSEAGDRWVAQVRRDKKKRAAEEKINTTCFRGLDHDALTASKSKTPIIGTGCKGRACNVVGHRIRPMRLLSQAADGVRVALAGGAVQ